MSVPGKQEMSLRPSRFEYKRLVWALVISLAFHLFCFGGYEFTRTVLPGWLQHIKFLAALAQELQKKPTPPPPHQPTEAPLMFVQVNPATATPEPPKDAKYYASQNSKAANPDTADSDIPKITGQQEHVAKTEDAPRIFAPMRPAPTPPSEAQKAEQEQKPEQARPKPPVGDLAMAKPNPTLQPDKGTAEQTRPRTLAEARMRQQPQNNQMPGQKMKQDGGVHRRLAISGFDAKATSFGQYDTEFIEAVEQRWFNLLDQQNFALDRTGKVVLQFRLTYDGRITDMAIAETTVGQTLAYVCQFAVMDNAPYRPWPSDMRRELGDSRNIQFTFYY